MFSSIPFNSIYGKQVFHLCFVLYVVAWKVNRNEKLAASVVGHVPAEMSIAMPFFLYSNGALQGTLIKKTYQPSPIVIGGWKFF